MARFHRKGRGKRRTEHTFSEVPRAEIQRSVFNRSHTHKTTFDSGLLIPIYVDEVLPGDTFNLSLTSFCRLSTPIFPIMDNLMIDFQFFFVPNRLLWKDWQHFNGEQDNPGDSTEFAVPVCKFPNGISEGTIWDYMGIPPGVKNIEMCSFYPRAYNLIWNEFYRDENLQDSLAVTKEGGEDDISKYALMRRGKRHDYFTSALPWPQKGPGVGLPIAGSIQASGDLHFNGSPVFSTAQNPNNDMHLWYQKAVGSDGRGFFGTNTQYQGMDNQEVTAGMLPQASGTMDLSGVTAATINDLRQAFQLQKLLERDARGGTRYTEILRSHFGVTSPDSRLQRPEYLGGGSLPVHVSQVLQTSSTDDKSPQGNTAAFGVSAGHGVHFSKSFVEHGVIIGLASVRADYTYQQGISRIFSRKSRFDYYWPALSHIGEQAVLNKEIYAQGNAQDEEVFGYQERYAEYRYNPSRISGRFRSTSAAPLDAWHLAQKFDNLPKLNADFIQENPPVNRIVAVQSEPQFIADFFVHLRCVRPMPVFGVPGLIDHF